MRVGEIAAGIVADAMIEFLTELQKATNDRSMHLPQILTLLALYRNPDLNQLDLPAWTGVERSANSRNLSKLGQGERPLEKAGPGWVEAYEDLNDRRFNRARLTPKGNALIEKIVRQTAAVLNESRGARDQHANESSPPCDSLGEPFICGYPLLRAAEEREALRKKP